VAKPLGPWQRPNTTSLSSALGGLLPVIRHPPTRRHVNRDGPSPVRAWSIWSYAYVAMAAAVIVSPQLAIRRSGRRRPLDIGRRHRPGRSGRVEGEGLHAVARRTYRAVGTNRRSTAVHRGRDHRHLLRAHDAFVKREMGSRSSTGYFLFAATENFHPPGKQDQTLLGSLRKTGEADGAPLGVDAHLLNHGGQFVA
jgi:hypothetical protein